MSAPEVSVTLTADVRKAVTALQLAAAAAERFKPTLVRLMSTGRWTPHHLEYPWRSSMHAQYDRRRRARRRRNR
jgi:hypothetical protein